MTAAPPAPRPQIEIVPDGNGRFGYLATGDGWAVAGSGATAAHAMQLAHAEIAARKRMPAREARGG